MNALSDWTVFKYDKWRRVGDKIECYSTKKTLPAGIIALENAQITGPAHIIGEYEAYYFIRVRVKRWETQTIQTVGSD